MPRPSRTSPARRALDPCPDHPWRERRMFWMLGGWRLDTVCGPCRTRIEAATRRVARGIKAVSIPSQTVD